MRAQTPWVMPLWCCLTLVFAGVTGPIGFAVLVAALPHLQAVASTSVPSPGPDLPPSAAAFLHSATLSATHWNRIIVSEGHADDGVYAANYRTSHDPEQEDETLRTYRRYPVGATITKHHFSTLADAQAWKNEEFITRMVRTASGHGPDQDPWRYERISADGQHVVEGFADDSSVRIQCAGCHVNAAQRDFIFATHLGDD